MSIETPDDVLTFWFSEPVEAAWFARSEDKALAIARKALDQEFDQQTTPRQRPFFYLPLMHSENIEDQSRCVELYKALSNPYALDFAVQHHDIIEQFGRFPHRNSVLGRETTAAEARFLEDHSGF